MATRTRMVNQDNGFGFPLSGKVSIPEKNEGCKKKARRPLQELNLENLPRNKGVDIVAAKPDKLNQEKVKKNGGRRALGDLTNRNKLLQRDVSSLKGIVVVPEEGSLHDHRECKKAQRSASAMDIDYFLETVGFSKDCLTPLMSLKLPPPSTSKLESPPIRLEFDCYESLSPTASPQLVSPVRHLDHDVDYKMPHLGIEWDAFDICGFKMDSTPK